MLAIHQDGTVRSWGLNTSGQLGRGNTTNSTTPILVNNLTDVVKIAAYGLTTSAGYSTSFAIKADGTLWAWGGNAVGQLGLGYTSTTVTSPEQVTAFSNVKAVAPGVSHTLFLLENGEVWGAGNVVTGLSYGSTPQKISNDPVFDPDGVIINIKKIFAGGHANNLGVCFAIDENENVYAWGNNNASVGQFGINSTTALFTVPVRVSGISRIGAIANIKHTTANTRSNAYFGNAPTGNSGVWTAGAGANYALGNSTTTAYNYLFHP